MSKRLDEALKALQSHLELCICEGCETCQALRREVERAEAAERKDKP